MTRAVSVDLGFTPLQTKIISRVDLNAPLPHSLINFLTRKLAGIILYVMQRQVMRVITEHHCQHAQRIRSNCDFYRDWLLPKLRYRMAQHLFKREFVSLAHC